MAPLRTNQIGNQLNMTFKSNTPYFKFHHIWCFFTGYSAVFLKRTHFSSQTNQTLGVQKCVGTDMCCMDYLPLKKPSSCGAGGCLFCCVSLLKKFFYSFLWATVCHPTSCLPEVNTPESIMVLLLCPVDIHKILLTPLKWSTSENNLPRLQVFCFLSQIILFGG